MRGEDLNLRPSGYEPDELPGCSTAQAEHSQGLGRVKAFATLPAVPRTATSGTGVRVKGRIGCFGKEGSDGDFCDEEGERWCGRRRRGPAERPLDGALGGGGRRRRVLVRSAGGAGRLDLVINPAADGNIYQTVNSRNGGGATELLTGRVGASGGCTMCISGTCTAGSCT